MNNYLKVDGNNNMKPIKKVTVVAQVVEKIKEYIKEESLAYGAKLPSEMLLCEQLEIARSSLREAYRILQAQGIITIKVGRGTFVSSPLMNDSEEFQNHWFSQHKVRYDDLLEVREVLEKLAVRKAAANIGAEGIEALEKNLADFKDLMDDTRNYKQLAKLDRQFHHILHQEANNPILLEINERIEEELFVFRCAMMKIPGRAGKTYLPHFKILSSVKNRDEEMSVEAMQSHLTEAHSDMEEMAEQQHAYN